MYFGALLLVACALQIYMVATVDYIGTDNPAGFSVLSDKIERSQEKLQEMFDAATAPRRPALTIQSSEVEVTRKHLGLPPEIHAAEPVPNETYSSALSRLVSETALQTGMRSTVLSASVDNKKPPLDLIQALRYRQRELEKRPVVVWGIEAPVTLPFQYGAAQYQVPNWVVANLLFIALIPLCIGWLGSLYFTRQRELFLIRKLADYKAAFPHILNILPVIPISLNYVAELRLVNIKRKNRSRAFNRTFYSLLRTLLILIFTTPMLSTLAYSVVGLLFVKNNPSIWVGIVALILGIILVAQVTMLVVQEWWLLWGKDFTA
ncbi:hypothetical protein KZJ38_07155 [Paraburkholderia edwinii]|uniref:Uncharacterized protein n=1 Tax=Paraburkholderia edwinii TaxID=2861782 RepID=A0ABX8UM76_9BURK|nr:hypothetical protein [Paraburkholderia edwinii]QYD70082.1 hypothetical protein KZJ38_07155 [Paraburkholderia edwinii]